MYQIVYSTVPFFMMTKRLRSISNKGQKHCLKMVLKIRCANTFNVANTYKHTSPCNWETCTPAHLYDYLNSQYAQYLNTGQKLQLSVHLMHQNVEKCVFTHGMDVCARGAQFRFHILLISSRSHT